jgi:hypothetical protein
VTLGIEAAQAGGVMDGISPTVRAMLERTARDWGLQPSATAAVATARVPPPARLRASQPTAQQTTQPTTRAVALAGD